MTDFKTTLLELAEPSDKAYASEDLKALESKSNFVLKSDAVEDLGGPEGSAVFLEYSASSNQPSFAGMLCEDASSNSLGLFLHFYGSKLNDELFYLVLQNFRSMLRLPGVMVKGAGKDLWIRIGKKAQAQGIGLKELAAVLSARIQEEFPEIESVQACFLRGQGPIYKQLGRKEIKTIGTVRDEILRVAEEGDRQAQEELADKVDYLTARVLDEGKDFSFLAMGHMESKGCFCSVNDLLQQAISYLTNEFNTVLIDGEAGIEQINRQVVEKIDTLIVLTDSSFRGMKTISHIKEMRDEGLLPFCKKIGVVFNRTRNDVSKLEAFAKELGLEIFGAVPMDEEVEAYDSEGKSLLELSENNPALEAVRQVYKKL